MSLTWRQRVRLLFTTNNPAHWHRQGEECVEMCRSRRERRRDEYFWANYLAQHRLT